MKHNYLRVAACTPEVAPGRPSVNAGAIREMLKTLREQQVDVAIFPELALCGATIGDMVENPLLLRSCEEQIEALIDETADSEMIIAVGLPFAHEQGIYDGIACIQSGELLAVKVRGLFGRRDPLQRGRVFSSWREMAWLNFAGREMVCFSSTLDEQVLLDGVLTLDVDFYDERILKQGRMPMADTEILLLAGATRATPTDACRVGERLGALSANGMGIGLACAGLGESTTDFLLSGGRCLVENGQVLARYGEAPESGFTVCDFDLDEIRRIKREHDGLGWPDVVKSTQRLSLIQRPAFNFDEQMHLLRPMNPHPFIPEAASALERILTIQGCALAQRMKHIGADKALLGISGGLDSALALLTTRRAFGALGLELEGIHAISMPAFGTSDRTRRNARALAETMGVSFREIALEPVLNRHFEDIGLNGRTDSPAFENAQARERTQVLMDMANDLGGLVVGTGDLSEIALGWSTYNGDHMSMYGVNASIPKTLVQRLVSYEAECAEDEALAAVLRDIVDTPISPELLPADHGQLVQKTEAIIGPYELHDFFLYHGIYRACGPAKLLFLTAQTFAGRYDEPTILRWMQVFFRRFVRNQFKRSCSPDAVCVFDESLSPRGGWAMPSDMSERLWTEEIEALMLDYGVQI